MSKQNGVIINPYQLVGLLVLLKGILSTFKVFAPESSGGVWTWVWIVLGILLIAIPYYSKTEGW